MDLRPQNPALPMTTAALLAIGAIALGPAMMGKVSFYDEWSMKWLFIASVAAVAAVVSLGLHRLLPKCTLTCILIAGLIFSFCLLFTNRPGSWGDAQWFHFGPRQHQEIPKLHSPGLLLQRQRAQVLGEIAWNLKELKDLAQTPARQKYVESLILAIRSKTRPSLSDVRLTEEQLREMLALTPNPEQKFLVQDQIDILESAQMGTRYQVTLIVWAFFILLALLPFRAGRIVGLPLALATFFMIGLWVLRTNDKPFIDVWVFQQQSAHALLHGQNPYAITFPNIYGAGIGVYGSDLQSQDRVNFGYPYMPLSLFMAIPGYLLKGDVRYAHLVALTLAAAFIAYSRPGCISKMAGLLLLLSPRSFMVLEMAWTEPFVIFWLAATISCACRWPKGLPYALGLFLATKQYLIFAVPLSLLLWPGGWKFVVKVVLTAIVVTAPLALWNFPAFWHSAVTLQLHQPLRDDALSFLIWFYRHVNPQLAQKLGWVAFAAAGVMVLFFLLFRSPRYSGERVRMRGLLENPALFSAALGITYLAFYALNRQAFCNYYYFVVAALLCAVALTTRASPEAPARVGGQSR